MSVLLYLAVFAAGAYLALVARALVGRHADRRIEEATEAALAPEHLEKLRAYLREIDEHEQGRHELKKLGVHLP